MIPALRQAVARALGQEIAVVRPVAGGDINDAYNAVLASGRSIFLKTHTRAAPRMFPCEARGLEWLGETGALRVPRVLAVSPEESAGPHFLALEFVRSNPRAPDFDERLGRGLAELHRAGAEHHGLAYDNYIATIEQDNTPSASWSRFYAEQRLLPLCARAVEAGRAPASFTPAFERLAERMPELAGPEEQPARLHGDLWNGNVHTDERGHPVLIDPAVYGGHREVDLAMLALFGGASRRVLDAYHEVHPLAPGHQERVPLYQLYPLLVHVNLFGRGYIDSTLRVLERYGVL